MRGRGDLPILCSWTRELANRDDLLLAPTSEHRRRGFRCGHGWGRPRGRTYMADSDANTGVSATEQVAAPVSSKSYGVGR